MTYTKLVNGVSVEMSAAEISEFDAREAEANSLAGRKGQKLAALANLAKAKLEGGTTVNGLKVSTDADAKGLLALGKMGGKASRKIVTSSGQRATMSALDFDGLVAAVDNFGQAVMDRHYDLIGAIDASTTMTELQAIDITTGWPA